MSSRAKPKRRGHVQQYSTSGGAGGPELSSAGSQPRPSILAPPLATIPRPNVGNQGKSHSETHGQDSQRALDQPFPVLGLGEAQNDRSFDSSRVTNDQHFLSSLEPQTGLETEEQQDPWDEEIGEIPWEDEGAQEPSQEPSQELHTSHGANMPAVNDNFHAENPRDSHMQASSGLDDDLEDLPWDDEDEQVSEHGNWQQNAQNHEHDHDLVNDTQAGLPWDSVGLDEFQAESFGQIESQAESFGQNELQEAPLGQEEFHEEPVENRASEPALVQSSEQPIKKEANAWDLEHDVEQDSRLPWEINTEEARDSQPQADAWDAEYTVEESQNYQNDADFTNNTQNTDYEAAHTHDDENIGDFDLSRGTWQDNAGNENQASDNFFSQFENEQKDKSQTQSHTGDLPWDHETTTSLHSHRSILDEEEPQTLNLQESDHPSITSLTQNERLWQNEGGEESQYSQRENEGPEFLSQSHELANYADPETHELHPTEHAEPNTENEQDQWALSASLAVNTQTKLDNPYNTEVQIQGEGAEKHSGDIPEQQFASQTPWPSVYDSQPDPQQEQANHDVEAEGQNEAAVPQNDQGLDALFNDSDVTSFDLTSTSHNAGFGMEDKKAKALELLDLDDDLLLDDDFLDDEPDLPSATPVQSTPAQAAPVQVSSTNTVKPATKSSFANKYSKPIEDSKPSSQYAPSFAVPRSTYAAPPSNNLIPSNVAAKEDVVVPSAVKKNDAYDFPVEFATQKVKPASRASSSTVLPRNATPGSVPGPGNMTGQQHTAPGTSSGASQKPFFEDLPVALPKPANKAKRAAPAATSASPKIPQPPVMPQEPTKSIPMRSPKNPYATLAPKAGIPAQKPQTPGIPDRNGAPSRYQPTQAPVPRQPQQSLTPVPIKSGVLPPPGVNLQNTSNVSGVYPPNNGPVVANQYAPAPSPGNQYAPGANLGSQSVQGHTQGSNFAHGTGGENSYSQNQASVNQYAQMPAPGNQYAQMPAPGNQYAQMPAPGNQYAQMPAPGNQYAQIPAPGHQMQSGTVPGMQLPQGQIPQFSSEQRPMHQAPPGQTSENQYSALQSSGGGFSPALPPANQYAPAPMQNANSQLSNVQVGSGATHTGAPVSRVPKLNTALGKNTEKSNTLSPYVPNTGPYGPSARTHSRANSLMGGNAKEGNPYAPAVPGMKAPLSPGHVTTTGNIGMRKRGKSGARSSLPKIDSVPEKLENPEALLKRQFPIFNWGPSDQAAFFSMRPTNGFEMPQRVIRVAKISELAPRIEVYAEFPGPLLKSKTKKKDIEAWIEKNIAKLKTDYTKADELLLNELLFVLVQNDGEFTSSTLHKKWAAILTPNVDFTSTQSPNTGFAPGSGPGTLANAYKLDNAGVNAVWALVQAGNREGALNYAISKQDWAFAFIIAQSLGQDTFSKVCSDYARISFPFQTNQNTRVQHLMPLLLKIFAGNAKSVIDDFVNVSSEAEFAKAHYRDIISAAIINGTGAEFLIEFGNFLKQSGLTTASEVCFILAGLVPSRVPLQNGSVFFTVGSFTSTSIYCEIYEYILTMSTTSSAAIPPTGLPDLLPAKIRRAQVLADMGHFAASRKYCDHIGGVLKALGKSPFITANVSADFKHLLLRLSDCSSSESGWLGGKLSRVNLDKVWGQLDKFIGGEDSSAKPGEKGVFSKFSPTLSRKSSMLDITSAKPQRSDGIIVPSKLSNGPQTEFTSPSQRSRRPAAPQKFATGLPSQSHSNAQAPLSNTQAQGHSNGGPGTGALGRYHPQSGGSSSVSLVDSVSLKKYEGRQLDTPSAPTQHPRSTKSSIYGNHAARLSSSSIASQNASHGPSASLASPKRPMVSNARAGIAEQDRTVPSNFVNGHSRSSSHQSEHYEPSKLPVHKEYERKSSIPEEASVQYSPGGSRDEPQINAGVQNEDALSVSSKSDNDEEIAEKNSHVEGHIVSQGVDTREPINEVNEMKESDEGYKEHGEVDHSEKLDEHENIEGDKDEPVSPDISRSTLVSPPPAPSAPVAKKANPYAPGGGRRNQKGNNRYGPGAATSSTNRYKLEPKSADGNLAGTSRGTPFSEPMEESGQDVTNEAPEEKQEVEEEDEQHVEEDNTHVSKVDSAIPQPPLSNFNRVARAPVNNMPRTMGSKDKRNPYAPPPKAVASNVDISFDPESHEDIDDRHDEPRADIILGQPQSPTSAMRQDYVNPYQAEKKVVPDTPIRSGFDEFPIPGSPEYTTRANSVIGHTGLYSSRLSQSQQSALYQQYEVKDDTVLDYVPVPEEKEENKSREESRKKDMADAKQKIQEEMSRKGGGQNAESGWFKGWLGNKKNDDKPKPIRAKLGKANTFKYDETHKRWIDSSRPLEEQLKEAAPPPPPKKKIQADKPQGEAPAIAAPAPMRGPSAIPSTIGGRRQSITKAPGKPTAEPVAPRPNLANAGLDDLLNLSNTNKGPAAAGKRGKRRYVNVMETK